MEARKLINLKLKNMKKILLTIVLISIFSCATSSGFNRKELRSKLNPKVQVTEESIRKALTVKPQLPKPFKLAVYFYEPTSKNSINHYSNRNKWSWTYEDKKIFTKELSKLVGRGEVSKIIILNDALVDGEGRKAIRLAAARTGSDAVLILNGISDIDRYNNDLGISYILLVTTLFVPASELDALVMLNASMWDVRNDYLYLSADSEHKEHQTAPAYFIDTKKTISLSKSKALKVLEEEVFTGISNMAN